MINAPFARWIATLFLLATFSACGEPALDQQTLSQESVEPTLVGQLWLPEGRGSRGVEVLAEVRSSSGELETEWVRFDEQGRFSHRLRGDLIRVDVTSAIGLAVHSSDGEALLDLYRNGQINLGSIDLRDQLTRHRQLVRATEDSSLSEVRVGMWFGKPPEGVALGSAQFPPIHLGTEYEWLLPHAADSIYLLVERRAGTGRGTQWRGGEQQLFGPFNSDDIPAVLVLD